MKRKCPYCNQVDPERETTLRDDLPTRAPGAWEVWPPSARCGTYLVTNLDGKVVGATNTRQAAEAVVSLLSDNVEGV